MTYLKDYERLKGVCSVRGCGQPSTIVVIATKHGTVELCDPCWCQKCEEDDQQLAGVKRGTA